MSTTAQICEFVDCQWALLQNNRREKEMKQRRKFDLTRTEPRIAHPK
jgi:hypothetical protein